MPKKTTTSGRNNRQASNGLTTIRPYILTFLVMLIGGASLASFVVAIISAFTSPILCVPFGGTFALTLRIAYGIVKLLLNQTDAS